MTTVQRPAVRKRQIVGWRQVERQKASIRNRQRSVAPPKQPR